MNALDLDHFRELLQDERKRVLDSIQYIQEEHPDGDDEMNLSTHLADNAALTLDQEIDETLEENSENLLAAIDAALARIEDGTYGTCQNCGQPIPAERLEAVPYATMCIDCKRREERE